MITYIQINPRARALKSVSVSALSMITLFAGIVLSLCGLYKTGWSLSHSSWNMGPSLEPIAAFFLLVFGIPAVLVGWGLLHRHAWARVLLFILAGLVELFGLLFIIAAATTTSAPAKFPFYSMGVLQCGYGVMAIVILIKRRAEFSRIPSLAHDTRGPSES